MGKLREKMTEDLLLRRYAPSTRERYLSCARAFVAYHRRPPEQMGEQEVRQFMLHLALEKQVGAATQKMHVAAVLIASLPPTVAPRAHSHHRVDFPPPRHRHPTLGLLSP